MSDPHHRNIIPQLTKSTFPGRIGLVDFDFIEWDEEDGPSGNVLRIALNGLVPEELEEVLYDPAARDDISRASGRPARFGWTSTGKHIIVIYEIGKDSGITVLRPVTAYQVELGG